MSTLRINYVKEGFLKKKSGSQKEKKTSRKNWSTKYFILTSGTLFYYSSQSDESPKGAIQLKDCTIEESPQSSTNNNNEQSSKKPNSFALHTNTLELWLQAENEEKFHDWVTSIRSNLGLSEQPTPERPKGKGLIWKTEKKLMEKAANSQVGKTLLKEYLPDDTWYLLDTLRRFITNLYSDAKAKEIEQKILKIGVKVAILFKGGHLTSNEMMSSCQFPILEVWERVINCCDQKRRCEAEFQALVKARDEVLDSFEILLTPHITTKSLNQMKEAINFFTEENIKSIFNDQKNQSDLEKCNSKLKILKSMFLWMK